MRSSLQTEPMDWADGPAAAPAVRKEPRTLKAVVLVLALAATAKVGLKEYMYHTASSEVIAAAYRERAADACRQHPGARDYGLSDATAFTDEARSSVGIGKSEFDVYLWQTDHPKWDARYRNPYLNLATANRTGGGTIVCEYDIVNSRAALRRK